MSQGGNALARPAAPGGRSGAVTGWVRLTLLAALLATAAGAGNEVADWFASPAAARTGDAWQLAVVAALLVYVVLMALPFCPGIELGLALMLLGGREIVLLVYLATVAALVLAFLAGQRLPPQTVIGMLELLRLQRARDLLLRLAPLAADERLRFLVGCGNPRIVRLFLRSRYLAVALALNTPGNLVIGDGGGIALAAGFSRLFSTSGFVLTVALAVAPVPLALLVALP